MQRESILLEHFVWWPAPLKIEFQIVDDSNVQTIHLDPWVSSVFPDVCSPPRQINHRRHYPVPLRYFEIMSLPWALCSRTSQAGNQDQWLSPKKEDKNTTFLLVVSKICLGCFTAPGAACCSHDPASMFDVGSRYPCPQRPQVLASAALFQGALGW